MTIGVLFFGKLRLELNARDKCRGGNSRLNKVQIKNLSWYKENRAKHIWCMTKQNYQKPPTDGYWGIAELSSKYKNERSER